MRTRPGRSRRCRGDWASIAGAAGAAGQSRADSVSEAEYGRDWYDPGDISYEWNRGRLEERPVSDFETFQVYAWRVDLLRHYLRLQPIGKLVALQMGFRFRIDDLITRPDLAAMRRGLL